MTDRLAPLLEEWGASDPAMIADTKTSRVLRVRLVVGGTAVVKDLKPVGLADELRGADYLAWRDGAAAVRLLAQRGSTLLLEDAGSFSLLDHLHRNGDDAATAIAADTLRQMHAPSAAPPPATLRPLDDWFVSLFALVGSGDEILDEGAAMARRLLARQQDVRPLHGDVHHANLHRSRRGWLAIDPKGLLGDPAYDAGNMFYNPLGRDDLRLDPDRARRMASSLGRALEREPMEILRWGFAHACLSASWHLEDGNRREASRSLAVAATLRSVIRRR